jgi:hypothetical protein
MIAPGSTGGENSSADNIKLDTRKIGCDAADWIELAQEGIRFLALYFGCTELPDWLIG